MARHQRYDPMDPFVSAHEREIIDLESNSEDDSHNSVGFDSDSEDDETPTPNNLGYTNRPEDAIDLTALEDIPDVDVPPDSAVSATLSQPNRPFEDAELLSDAACLQMVLDVLPDISVDHVLAFIQNRNHPRTHEECERIITDLLDGDAYPKEIDEVNNKRKRKRGDDSDSDITKYENGEHNIDDPDYQINAWVLFYLPVVIYVQSVAHPTFIVKALSVIWRMCYHLGTTPTLPLIKQYFSRCPNTIVITTLLPISLTARNLD